MSDDLPGRPRLLFVPDVAERLNMSPATIRWMIQKGTGPRHAKIGRRIVFRESDVEQFIDDAFEKAS